MAGRRKTSGAPLRYVARPQRRAALVLARIGAEDSWAARLPHALDRVRAGLADFAAVDPSAAERAAERVVDALLQAADDIDRATVKRGRAA